MLDLSHNQLSFMPPDLPEALEELHLQGNRISYVGPEAFLSTPRLRALFLRCPEGGRAGLVAKGRGGPGWAVVDPSSPGGSGLGGLLPLHPPSRPPLRPGPTGFT